MKIAYLITAYNNFSHLEKLINTLDQENVFFFIHVDKKSIYKTRLNKPNILYIKSLKVWWGGWSHMQAILNLIRIAISTNVDYFILLSGTDYPIRPNSFLVDKLSYGVEYINIIQGFTWHKPESRIKYYYFDLFDRRRETIKTKFFCYIENIMRKIATKKNHCPCETFYFGSTWWALSKECITYILEYANNNPQFVKFFKSSFCPEESFIHTIIGNSSFKEKCKNNLTYTDWSTTPSPAEITSSHILLFMEKTQFTGVYGTYSPFFARKFNDGSEYLLEIIDKKLRI